MDSDGNNPKQLTDSPLQGFDGPDCSPDGSNTGVATVSAGLVTAVRAGSLELSAQEELVTQVNLREWVFRSKRESPPSRPTSHSRGS
jgi:hypothetical protein